MARCAARPAHVASRRNRLDLAAMDNETERPVARPTFRTTLLRVMAVQVITLILLWLLQSRYGA